MIFYRPLDSIYPCACHRNDRTCQEFHLPTRLVIARTRLIKSVYVFFTFLLLKIEVDAGGIVGTTSIFFPKEQWEKLMSMIYLCFDENKLIISRSLIGHEIETIPKEEKKKCISWISDMCLHNSIRFHHRWNSIIQ